MGKLELEKTGVKNMTAIYSFIKNQLEVIRPRRQAQVDYFFYDLMSSVFMIIFMLLVGFIRQTENHWLMAFFVSILPVGFYVLLPFAKYMSFGNDSQNPMVFLIQMVFLSVIGVTIYF